MSHDWSGTFLSRPRRARHVRGGTDSERREVQLAKVAFNPDDRQVRNPVQGLTRCDAHALQDAFLDHDARYRRSENQRGTHLSLLLDGAQLVLGHVPPQEPLSRGIDQALAVLAGVGRLRRRDLVAISERRDQVALRSLKLRAREREERLTARNSLTDRAHVQLVDPAIELEVHIRQPRLVVPDAPGGSECAGQRAARNARRSDPDELLAPAIDHDTGAVEWLTPSRCSGCYGHASVRNAITNREKRAAKSDRQQDEEESPIVFHMVSVGHGNGTLFTAWISVGVNARLYTRTSSMTPAK